MTDDVKFNPEATDGDGDGMVQDGTEFERPIEDLAVDPTETPADDVITAPEPVESAPAITPVADGVIGTGTTTKKPKAKVQPVESTTEKVALHSEKNIYWDGVGKIHKGYNIVNADAAEKWLRYSYIRLATPEEVKQQFG